MNLIELLFLHTCIYVVIVRNSLANKVKISTKIEIDSPSILHSKNNKQIKFQLQLLKITHSMQTQWIFSMIITLTFNTMEK